MNSPLAGSPHIYKHEGDLFIEGCRAAELAALHGTPLYVYSRASMLAVAAEYADSLTAHPHRLCYSVKANSNLAILKLLADAGWGFDIVSGGELQLLQHLGVEGSKIVFSGVGKTRQEMRAALKAKVGCFNVESEAELRTLSRVATENRSVAPVSIRINPHVDALSHPYISTGLKSSKFGIDHSRAVATYLLAAESTSLKVVGIDCHIGSQITELAPFLEALDRILDLVEEIEIAGVALEHVDVGGGLGIRYCNESPPPPGDFVRAVVARLLERGHGGKTLVFEPGRSVVANAGVLITEVSYLKRGQEKSFCIVDAGMNEMMRPSLYGAWMDITECRSSTATEQMYEVVGPVCESGDWLGRDRMLRVSEFDHLAILSAGAYGYSMASNYNTRARPAEVLVDNGRYRLIRAREDLEQRLAADASIALASESLPQLSRPSS